MRFYLVFVVGLLALLLQPQSLLAQLMPFPENPSVKLRLEVEIQGMLSVTEKSATITIKETIYEWVEVGQSPDPDHRVPAGGPILQQRSRVVDTVWVLKLDDNLKKVAKTLHGKEAVVVGKCLVLGVESRASTSKTPPKIRYRTVQQPRGGGRVDVPEIESGGIATTVASQLRLDPNVTVISLQAAK